MKWIRGGGESCIYKFIKIHLHCLLDDCLRSDMFNVGHIVFYFIDKIAPCCLKHYNF